MIPIKKFYGIKVIGILLLSAIFFMVFKGCQPAPANAKSPGIPEYLAVKALLGECGGQEYDEIVAHAFALRNRGTLRGVHGLLAKPKQPYTDEQVYKVKKAWKMALKSKFYDPVDGRTEWRSDYDLIVMIKIGETPYSQGLYDGLQVGDTVFFRLRKTK